METIRVNQFGVVPVQREFDCGYCGRFVKVIERTDRRFRYCSAKCEKQFWRERSKHKCTNLQTLSVGGITRKLALEQWENKQYG